MITPYVYFAWTGFSAGGIGPGVQTESGIFVIEGVDLVAHSPAVSDQFIVGVTSARLGITYAFWQSISNDGLPYAAQWRGELAIELGDALAVSAATTSAVYEGAVWGHWWAPPTQGLGGAS